MNITIDNKQPNTNNSVLKQKGDIEQPQEEKEELTLEQQMEKSAVEVSISMNAQIILLAMDSMDTTKENATAQKSILDFLSGKAISDDFKLENTGYTGKPISELTPSEAKELVSEDGFFGVEKTAQRVANFAISLADDNLESLQKIREGVIQGFKDAEDMWGGELPEISYKTQNRTLEIIDEKLAQLEE